MENVKILRQAIRKILSKDLDPRKTIYPDDTSPHVRTHSTDYLRCCSKSHWKRERKRANFIPIP